jgi:hypothetical protein
LEEKQQQFSDAANLVEINIERRGRMESIMIWRRGFEKQMVGLSPWEGRLTAALTG